MAASLRYFGVTIAEVDIAALRTDAMLGRFCPVPEPLPVGTAIELDGAPHHVTRVDEGQSPGIWVWKDSVARPIPEPVPEPVPEAVNDGPTTRQMPTVVPPAEDPEADEYEEERIISFVAEPSNNSQVGIPAIVDDMPPDNVPGKDEPPDGSGGKRKRRPKKTVIGR